MEKNLITIEALEKRGYFHFTRQTKKQRISGHDDFSCSQKMKELSNDLLEIKKQNPEYEEFMDILEDCWIKCIPETKCSEATMSVVVCLMLSKHSDGWILGDSHYLLRFDYTGAMRMGIYDYECSSGNLYMNIPYSDDAKAEIEMLEKNRFIPSGFSFIGKPMPKNKEAFHANPPYSLSMNSGWRNANWHMSIEVDEHDLIKDIEFSTWENTSMFERPRSCEGDEVEEQDALTCLSDQYSDEEWRRITS